jgi:hypothetical protein
MSKIMAFVKPYWKRIALVFVLTMTSTLFALEKKFIGTRWR